LKEKRIKNKRIKGMNGLGNICIQDRGSSPSTKGAWVDPWSCTLVDKTPDMFWGNLVLDQAVVGV
jgi:hypothetical protein